MSVQVDVISRQHKAMSLPEVQSFSICDVHSCLNYRW